MRLREEGYPVAGRQSKAAIRVKLSRQPAPPPDCDVESPFGDCQPEGWTVEARGLTYERFAVPSGGDPAITELEVYHRAIDALESVRPRPLTAEQVGPTFRIHFSPALSPSEATEAEREVLSGALLAGGTVVAQGERADYMLCVVATQPGFALGIREEGQTCPHLVRSWNPQTRPRVRAGQLVSGALAPEVDPAPPDLQPRRDSRRREPRKKIWPDARAMLRGGASLGVLTRSREADALIAFSFFGGLEPGVSVWLDVQVWPSATRQGLRITEILPAAGIRLRPFTRRGWSLDTGFLFGLLAHRWRFTGDDEFSGSDQGVDFDVSTELAIGPAFEVWGRHEVNLMLRAGRVRSLRRHVDPFGELWERENWRVGIAVGGTFGFELPKEGRK